MANSVFNLSITTNVSAQAAKDDLILARGSPVQVLQDLANWFNNATNGNQGVSIIFSMTGVQASGTITFSSFADSDTITINGTVLTGKTSPSGASQFAVGASNSACATNAAACINANTTLNKQVVASASGAVVTITAIAAGPMGNLGTLAISAHGSVSGANLTGGSSDVPITVAHGL